MKKNAFKYSSFFLILIISISMFFPFEVKKNSEKALSFKEKISSLPQSSSLLVSIAVDYPSSYEMTPMIEALVGQALRENISVVFVSLHPSSADMIDTIISGARKYFEKKERKLIYGKHYTDLGYVPGGIFAVAAMSENIKNFIPEDVEGTKLTAIPAMKNINNLNDFDCIADFFSEMSSGTYSSVLYSSFTVKNDQKPIIVSGSSAYYTTEIKPFVNREQIDAVISGPHEAETYIKLVDEKQSEKYSRYSFSYSVIYLAFIAVIIFANIFRITGEQP